jgi:hypothetical protein
MEKKLKRRQEDEGKQEVEEKARDKGKKEDQDQEPSQEDESDKPHDLEFTHPTSQPKPMNFLEAIFAKCLTLPNNLENHINL